jgi:excisionase family DNA binding protein
MATETATAQLIEPAPDEAQALDSLRELLDALSATGERGARLVAPGGTQVELPASAFAALRTVAHALAQGQTITLVPHGKELTTQQAADLLHISRTYLVKLLERDEIPYHYAGSHRRLKLEDVLDYRRRRAEHRRQKLAELTKLSEELGVGYD